MTHLEIPEEVAAEDELLLSFKLIWLKPEWMEAKLVIEPLSKRNKCTITCFAYWFKKNRMLNYYFSSFFHIRCLLQIITKNCWIKTPELLSSILTWSRQPWEPHRSTWLWPCVVRWWWNQRDGQMWTPTRKGARTPSTAECTCLCVLWCDFPSGRNEENLENALCHWMCNVHFIYGTTHICKWYDNRNFRLEHIEWNNLTSLNRTTVNWHRTWEIDQYFYMSARL